MIPAYSLTVVNRGVMQRMSFTLPAWWAYDSKMQKLCCGFNRGKATKNRNRFQGWNRGWMVHCARRTPDFTRWMACGCAGLWKAACVAGFGCV